MPTTRTFAWPRSNHDAGALYGMLAASAAALAASAALVYAARKLRHRDAKSLDSRVPPGDMGWPLFGETFAMVKDRVAFHEERAAKYDPRAYSTHYLTFPTVALGCAELNTFALRAEAAGLIEPGPTTAQRKLLGLSSVFSQTGAMHLRLRKLIAPCFSPEAIKGYVNVVDGCVMRLLERARSQTDALPPNKALSSDIFRHVAFEMLVAAAFEAEDLPDDKLDYYCELFTEISNGIASVLQVDLPFTALGRGLRARARAEQEIDALIAKYRATYAGQTPSSSPSKTSLLARLLQSRDDLGDPLTQQELRDAVVSLMFAGSETTFMTMSTLIALLFAPSNAHVLGKLRAEVHNLFGTDTSQPLDAQTLRTAPYLNAVMNEAWRAVPPLLGLPRFAKTDLELPGTGWIVPKGWRILVSLAPVHFSGQFWGAEPKAFDPDRFLAKSAQAGPSMSQYYLPFGGGSRMCLGEQLARLETRVFLVRIAQAYDFDVKSSTHKTFFLNRHDCTFRVSRRGPSAP